MAGEKTEAPLVHGGRQGGNGASAFEEKQQPMGLTLVRFFRYHREEVKVRWGDGESGFFVGFTGGAFKRGFPRRGFQLAADRAPRAEVGRFGSKEKELFSVVIFNEYKHGDFVAGG